MTKVYGRRARRRAAFDTLARLLDHPNDVFLVHYSCESFYNRKESHSPRVTSIAVRNFGTAQTQSFSIHQVAERQGQLSTIEEHYDELEKEMLDDFFRLVVRSRNMHWVHWNMRDINFGFPALEHRLKALGGDPGAELPDALKHDLARLLVDVYGLRYIAHPRLASLVERNGITRQSFLIGADEAEAFEKRDYVKLHQSTLRKVDIMATILERTAARNLKTDAKWRDVHGLGPHGIKEFFGEHPVGIFISLAIGAVGGTTGVIALVQAL